MFKALVIDNDEQGYRTTLKELDESQLPDHDVTLEVIYSTLNYKDALAIHNQGPIVRQFPMVPGIDFVGRVIASRHAAWREDDTALLTGWGVGEKQWGGLAQKASVSGDWLVELPAALSPLQSMAIGTAGLTAMLCVLALEKQGVMPTQGPVLVTGASGGVGSFSVSLLARLGYQVIASSGRADDSDYLIKTLGAASVIDRAELQQPGKPLAKERWAAAIDSVGSHTLSNVLAGTQRDGVVAACGIAQALDLPACVAPFILSGVTLTGVDSAMA
uniref:acrylyl-CoA reductase (NADPH) n=1 Tax=Pantoea sp. TaxID=69393 RepID=UPI00289A5469